MSDEYFTYDYGVLSLCGKTVCSIYESSMSIHNLVEDLNALITESVKLCSHQSTPVYKELEEILKRLGVK